MGDAGCFVFLLGLAGIVVCIYTVPRMVLTKCCRGRASSSPAAWYSSPFPSVLAVLPRTSAALLLSSSSP